MIRWFLILSPLFFVSIIVGQTSTTKLKTSCDCKTAIPINLSKSSYYGLTNAPNGVGLVQEFSSKLGDKKSFEKEHSSAWYLLNINYDGTFVFDIVPEDTTNDYDFLLFSYTDSNTCSDIIKKRISPIRSNISRNKIETNSLTGLSVTSKNDYASSGIGPSYSKPIDVKKGEKYLLVLDNVTPEGKGHTLFFSYIKFVEIKGIVKNADSIPMVAEIILSDNKGNIIAKTASNNSGEYVINTGLKENTNYSLTYNNDSYFFSANTINTNTLGNKKSFENINTFLPKLKKGNKYNVGNINFYGDQAIVLPESYSSLAALYKLMKKNKKMVILIEGHINRPGDSKIKEKSDLILSEQRAAAIANYLIANGIDKKRISTKGLGASQMLFPNPSSEAEHKANRRVEIKIISID